MATKKKTGPRGGLTTTHPSGLVRKVYYLYESEAEAIRRIAFDRHVTESEVIREAVDAYLDRER
jgi:Ribbon-helix-helix protein, copG family